MSLVEPIVADRPPTADELRRIQEEGGVEFVDGHVVEKHVSRYSSRTAARVMHLLIAARRPEDAVEVFDSSLAYRCFPGRPNRFRKPDASVVRRTRMREAGIGDDEDAGDLPIPPDLAVEVVSPNDPAYGVERKINEYLRAGFGEVWLVWPESRSVTIYRSNGTFSRLEADEELALPNLLPQLRIKTADLFS